MRIDVDVDMSSQVVASRNTRARRKWVAIDKMRLGMGM
jgi:hypothetical protein